MQRRKTAVVLFVVAAFLIPSSASQPLQFSPSLSRASVPETFVAGGYPRPAEGFVVVMCIDSAGAPANDVTYSIESNPVPFDVGATTGSLSVTADLDYETTTSYSFAVICANVSDPSITGTGMVQIDILPVNEFEPVLSRNSFQTTIFENAAVGTTIAANEPGRSQPGGPLRYTVTDGDDGPDGNITFTLSEGSQDNTENARFFDLDFITGSLVLRQRLDVDNIPNAFDRVALRITACDVYPPGVQCPSLLVDLIVFSANDNTPQFSADTYEVSYPESIPVGTLIITAICTDNDRGAGEFSGIEIYQPASEMWQLPNSQNGTVFLNMSLDYETVRMHEFTLRCFDTGGREDFAIVTVNVLPVSASVSQLLQFSPNISQALVPETFVAGGYPRPADGFVVVMCIDSAGAPAIDVTYSIDSNPGPFHVGTTTGSLSVTADLDYETTTSYSFAVICANASDLGTGMVQINILPVNEFEPVLSRNSFQTTIFENAAVGTTIAANEPGRSQPGGPLRYTVADGDDGPDGNITFTLSEGSQDNTENARFFDLDFITGSLVLRQRLDVDNIPNAFDRVALRITACDVYPPGVHCPNLLVDLIVFSANDNTPQFSADTYEVSYPESIPVGTLIITAICTDNDRGAGEFLGIEIYQPASEMWQLPNSRNGTVFLNMSLDYETVRMHEFTLRCFDTGGKEDFAIVTVNVLPVNDVQPVFTQTSYTFTVNLISSSFSSSFSDFEIGRVTAVDHDRDTGSVITYSMEENRNFHISSNDGRIFLVLLVDGSSFNLTVVADDGDFNATSLVYITCKVTRFLSIPEVILIGLAGLMLLVLVLALACCVLYCFKQWTRKHTANRPNLRYSEVPVSPCIAYQLSEYLTPENKDHTYEEIQVFQDSNTPARTGNTLAPETQEYERVDSSSGVHGKASNAKVHVSTEGETTTTCPGIPTHRQTQIINSQEISEGDSGIPHDSETITP